MKLAIGSRLAPEESYAYSGGKPFDPALPVVVFLHGALQDHSIWTLLARWFAHHGHAVLAPDLPGHGRSPGAPRPSIEALADWLIAVFDAAGVDEAALVGHSMGSLIALEAAARAPTRVRRLVMIGTAYPMVVSDALLTAGENDPHAAIDSVNAFSHSTIAGKPSYPGPGMWLHGSNRTLMRRMQDGQTGTNLFLNDFRVCNDYRHGLEAAALVRCPSTLVLGRRDQMTSPKQTAPIASALKAEVVHIEGGHALMTEAPDAVLAAVRSAVGVPG